MSRPIIGITLDSEPPGGYSKFPWYALRENYFGAVSKWGIDIGTTDKAVMRWLVFAPSSNIYAPGALAGDYLGASAEVTAAVGAGANLLAGGLNGSFTLQPLSLQTQTGLNLAVGVTRFQLRSIDN